MTTRAEDVQSKTYQAVVIGAGDVGCAVVRSLVNSVAPVSLTAGSGMGMQPHDILSGCLIVDQNMWPLMESSAANAGIIHTGFDASTGSIEQSCMQEGARLVHKLHEDMTIKSPSGHIFSEPFPLDKKGGSLLVARSEQEWIELKTKIVPQASRNGVEVELIEGEEKIRMIESNFSPSLPIFGGLLIKDEAQTDGFFLPFFLLLQALHRGASLLLQYRLEEATFCPSDKLWTLSFSPTSSSSSSSSLSRVKVRTHFLVNCAGLGADSVDRVVRSELSRLHSSQLLPLVSPLV